jgi:DNA modification methylase
MSDELAIIYRPVEELIPYARNARTHSEAQVAQIAGSIREFGFTNPVLLDGASGMLAGHGRVLAARKLGMDQVPCIELAHLSEAQRRAYILADNKLALNAGWDDALLRIELADLGEMAFDLSLIGFDEAERAALLDRNAGHTDPDQAPDPPAHPVSEPGDLWILGRHRLLCGDCTVATDVERLLDGTAPHLMVTDPPYGVEYDPNWRNEATINGATSGRARGVIGGRAVGKVSNDDRADWRDAWALFPGDVAYVWHGGVKGSVVQASLEACGFTLRTQIIWAKNNVVISRGHYHHQHEPCWYAVRESKTGHWSGDRTQSTLWQIDKNMKSETGHGTQKPVECMRRPIENNSRAGEAIYEPFSGSGTTIIAAEMTGRACHAIEIAPAYVDVAVKRWQEFTGQQAALDGDGRNFDDVAAKRLPHSSAVGAGADAA